MTLYVDDLLIFTNDAELKAATMKSIGQVFPIKDLGQAKYGFGIRITQRPAEKVILLDQRENVSRVLKRFNIADSKPAATPMELGVKLSKRRENEEGNRRAAQWDSDQ